MIRASAGCGVARGWQRGAASRRQRRAPGRRATPRRARAGQSRAWPSCSPPRVVGGRRGVGWSAPSCTRFVGGDLRLTAALLPPILALLGPAAAAPARAHTAPSAGWHRPALRPRRTASLACSVGTSALTRTATNSGRAAACSAPCQARWSALHRPAAPWPSDRAGAAGPLCSLAAPDGRSSALREGYDELVRRVPDPPSPTPRAASC